MGQLKLKSKMTKGCDYKSISVQQFAIPLKADQARYEKDLRNFCKRFAVKKEVSEIASQDMVTLSCSSKIPKFQKDHITVRIGLGLYSRELEQKLVGMPVGTTKILTVDPDDVTVTIEKSVREIIPELTDELAASCGIPLIKTVDDVHAYCRFKQYDDILEEAADDACACFAGEILKQSVFDLNEEEVKTAIQHVSDMMHFDPDEKTADDGNQAFLTREMVDQMGTQSLMAAIMGQEIKILTETDYEDYLNRRSVAEQLPLEDIRGKYPLTIYLIDTYNEMFNDTIEEYVLWKLKETGESMADETL